MEKATRSHSTIISKTNDDNALFTDIKRKLWRAMFTCPEDSIKNLKKNSCTLYKHNCRSQSNTGKTSLFLCDNLSRGG